MIKPQWYNIENLFFDEKCKHNRPFNFRHICKTNTRDLHKQYFSLINILLFMASTSGSCPQMDSNEEKWCGDKNFSYS